MVNAADLWIKITPYRATCGNIGFHYIANNFDSVTIMQNTRVLVGARNNLIPLSNRVSQVRLIFKGLISPLR